MNAGATGTETPQPFDPAMEAARLKALVDGDLAHLERCLAEELLFVHSDGRVDTKHSYLDLLSSGRLAYASLDQERLALIAPVESLACIHSRVSLVAQLNGEERRVHAYVGAMWMRTALGWRCVSVQSTPLPPPNARLAEETRAQHTG